MFLLSENKRGLCLNAQYYYTPASMWMLSNILAQKLPGPDFIVTAKMDASNLKMNAGYHGTG